MNQVLDIKRAYNFSKLRLNLNQKLSLITTAGYLALIFIISFFIAYHLPEGHSAKLNIMHTAAFMTMLFGGAVFFGGRAYIDMNSGPKSVAQLMIPASVFEKFIVPFLVTSVGWAVLSTILYQLFAILVNALWSGIFFNFNYEFFSVFSVFDRQATYEMMKYYFLFHALFFCGAAAFKKYPIAKTLLAGFIIQQGANLIGFIFILILFGNLMDFGMAVQATFTRPEIESWMNSGGLEKLYSWSYWSAAVALPIVLYIVAYFKLKEREA